ncbi:ATP-binding protein [Cellulomonas fimi]|uniref:Transcriptional regulator n=1 Tax=Cellulomonas fimi TaxID=1708 RepID=A0A7Y0QGF7_CELFI|nr:ATP-binding protein [Cellulomonas fimi]NMR19185.1 transcriptional regulator [Cellulomonas fimi]
MPRDDDVRAALLAVRSSQAAKDVETERLDFKTVGRSILDTLTDLAAAAACFANHHGGTVVVGVRDHPGGLDAFVGYGKLDAAGTRRAIFERTEPPLTVDVAELSFEGTPLLVITVPESAAVHAVGGRHTQRVGTSCMPMSADRIARLVADRRGDDWTDEATDLPVSAIDPIAMTTARQFLRDATDPARRAFAHLSDEDLLRALGVVAANGRLNHAGALLFVDDLNARKHTAYVHRRTSAGDLTANEQFSGPLVTTLARVLDLISARTDTTSVDVSPLVQVQVADLPPTAIREALVNAVMHRDYRDSSRIVVEHTATRLAVTSPGPFVSGVTTSNVLTTASRSRNPRLAEAIRKLGLGETAGMGVDRMYAAMARLGHQPPHFDADEATVRVTLTGGAPNAHVARFVQALPDSSADDADIMLTLLTLLHSRIVNAAGLSPLLQKPAAEVQTVLDRLAAPPFDLVEPTRETIRHAHPNYRLRETPLRTLGTAVTYRRRTTDSVDSRVLDLLRETGTINARMVRLVLETDASTTSRILGDMVDRGLLVKTSTAERGPSVTYGAGPKMPTSKKPTSIHKPTPGDPTLFEGDA